MGSWVAWYMGVLLCGSERESEMPEERERDIHVALAEGQPILNMSRLQTF